MPRGFPLVPLLASLIAGTSIFLSFGSIGCPPQAITAWRQQHSTSRRIDCTKVGPIQPVNLAPMESNETITGVSSFPVSFGFWDARLQGQRFKEHKPVGSNDIVKLVARILSNTPGSLVDVGANVGFMTNLALAMNRTVYAIEPIGYNVAKLCEARRQQPHQGNLRLYQAAAGPSPQSNFEISRPPDAYFDRASLTSANVPNVKVFVVEEVPMITVDSIVPLNETVAMVKIDVQGHEYGVLQGMYRLMSRVKPSYILYESDFFLMKQAGFEVQEVRALVESFGYLCTQMTGDTLCRIGV